MSKIIGLSGFKQTGKSTAAKHLEAKGYVRLNFKDALIEEMKQNVPDVLRELGSAYKLSIDELFDQKPPIMRALMMNYGTEIRRRDNPTYWIDQWEAKAEVILATGAGVVVDDVRFINEADSVRALGGKLIRIARPDIGLSGQHVTETEMLSFSVDYTITTEKGDFESLYTAIDKIVDNSTTSETQSV